MKSVCSTRCDICVVLYCLCAVLRYHFSRTILIKYLLSGIIFSLVFPILVSNKIIARMESFTFSYILVATELGAAGSLLILFPGLGYIQKCSCTILLVFFIVISALLCLLFFFGTQSAKVAFSAVSISSITLPKACTTPMHSTILLVGPWSTAMCSNCPFFGARRLICAS